MARRRVLALGPAMSRMMCMSHPYQQLRRSEDAPKRTWLWRRKKSSSKVKKVRAGDQRRRGLRVGRLRIRFLSPLAILKRMCDAYVRMMLSLEEKMSGAGISAAGPAAFPMYPMHMPGRMGSAPTFTYKVKVN